MVILALLIMEDIMGKGKRSKNAIINLGGFLADTTKHKDGSYTAYFMKNSGCRPEVGKVDVGNMNMLTEVFSWFKK